MLKSFYIRIVPWRVRDWMYRLRHIEARLEQLYFQRTRYGIRAYVERAAREHWLTGTVLEIGSGKDTFSQEAFQRHSPQVRFLRSELRSRHHSAGCTTPPVRYALFCDVTNLGVRSDSLDGLICSEVLEHVARYSDGVREMARVLKPSGKLLLTSPFLYPLHGQQDYWRFTPQAIEMLLSDHFRILDLTLVPLEPGADSFPVDIGVLAERK